MGLLAALFTLLHPASFPLRLAFHFYRRGPWPAEMADFERIVPVYEAGGAVAGALLAGVLGLLVGRGRRGPRADRIAAWTAAAMGATLAAGFGRAWYVGNRLVAGPASVLWIAAISLALGAALWLLVRWAAGALGSARGGRPRRLAAAGIGLAALLFLPAAELARGLERTPAPEASRPSWRPGQGPVYLIALDGLTWSVIDPLLASGKLPALSQLISRGVRADLVSQFPLVSPAIWTTIATGVSPHKHGITDWVGVEPATRQLVPVNATMRRVPALWDFLGSAGGRSGVVGYYVTWPAESIAGYMVSDLLEFTHAGELPDLARPASLLDSVDAEAASLAGLDRRDRMFGSLALRLMREDPADLFTVYLSGADEVQHAWWHQLRPREFRLDPSSVPNFGEDAVSTYYRAMDEFVGELVAAAGPEATVVIVSDHGFESTRRGERRIYGPGRLLEALGYLTRREGTEDIDWARTTVYLAGEPRWIRRFELYLNVAGREPHGVIPAADRDRVALEVAEALRRLRTDRGEALLRRVTVMGGKDEPDLCIEFDPDIGRRPAVVEIRGKAHDIREFCRPFGAALPESAGTPGPAKDAAASPLGITGDHHPRGVLVAAGPNLRRGVRAYDYDFWSRVGVRRKARVRDVAPTILYALGLPVPAAMSGRVLTGLFRDEYVQDHPVKAVVSYPVSRSAASVLVETPIDAETLQRLRALGYLQ